MLLHRRSPAAVLAVFLLASGLPAAASAAAPLKVTSRINESPAVAGRLFGEVAGPGDMNGDGIDDLALWRPGYGAGVSLGAGSGALYIVYGATNPRDLTVPPPNTDGFQIRAAGATPITGAKRLGDFDGDGKADLIVFADRIYVVYGAAGSGTVTLGVGDRSTALTNGISSVIPAQAVSAGDFNGDGKADILANRSRPAKFGWSQQLGAAVLFGGSRVSSYDIRFPSNRVATINGGVSCTWYACGESIGLPGPLGDVNGDGYDDLVAFTASPYVILGRPGAPELRAGQPDAQSIRLTLRPGTIVAGVPVGDVTGDGIDDITITNYAAGPQLWILPGRLGSAGTTVVVASTPTIGIADPALEPLGSGAFGVTAVGDLNGEGVNRFIASVTPVDAIQQQTGPTQLRLPALPAAPGTARISTAPLTEAPPVDRFGVVGVGDIDGDGLGDVAFSAPSYAVAGAVNSGAVFLATHKAGAPGPGPTPTTPVPTTPVPTTPGPTTPGPVEASLAGWSPSGSASVLPGSRGAQLTNATGTMQSGAIYDTRRKVDANQLTVEFDATIEGGAGQGNGLTLALASASQGGNAVARNADVGLGWVPNKGAAIVLGTVASSNTPGSSYAGISLGAGRYGFPALVQNGPVAPVLAGRTSHVKVEARGGTVAISVDGVQLVRRDNVELPTDAWLGFTASTGARTQRHVVSNVSVTVG